MQSGKAILGVAALALALMVGCTAREQASAPPEADDRAVAGAVSPGEVEESDTTEEGGTTGTLADARAVEGSPLADVAGTDLTLVIYFDLDSSEVHPDDRVVVEGNAQYLTADPNLEVELHGHADERGSREYNVALGERRANGVRDMLRLLGVADHQIRTVSYGEERPALVGHEEEAWSRNRRVEFVYGTR